MDHARNLSAVLCFDRDTVASVSHGDNRILQVGAGGAFYHRLELSVDLVVDLTHGAADLEQCRTGIVI